MKNYTVYMHISPSNKRYIGITSTSVERRWKNNGDGYKDQVFYRAIQKYGWDNIQHIIVAKGLTEEDAKWLEIELIREFDTTNKYKGYNVSTGGDGSNGCKHTEEAKKKISESKLGGNSYNAVKVVCLNTLEIFDSSSEAGRKYNINRSNILCCCKNNRYSRGKINNCKYAGKLSDGTPLVWRYYEDYINMTEEEIYEAIKEVDSRIILLNTLEVFESMREASRIYKIHVSSIGHCCKGYRIRDGRKVKKTYAGKLEDGTKLVWKYYQDYIREQNKVA